MFRSNSVDLTVREEDREWFIEQFAKRIETPEERELFGTVVEGMEFPETRAAYGGMLLDPVGNVWLRTGRHLLYYAPSREWTVLSNDGYWLGTLTLPENFDLHEVGSDYLLGTDRDELGRTGIRMLELQR